ncbi:hypothetical protein ACOSQ2_022584 [Xanthoceras sorbifolium]
MTAFSVATKPAEKESLSSKLSASKSLDRKLSIVDSDSRVRRFFDSCKCLIAVGQEHGWATTTTRLFKN